MTRIVATSLKHVDANDFAKSPRVYVYVRISGLHLRCSRRHHASHQMIYCTHYTYALCGLAMCRLAAAGPRQICKRMAPKWSIFGLGMLFGGCNSNSRIMRQKC
jgi:hypothetical protein